MLLEFQGMKSVVLACGASHLHLLTGSTEMNEAGIRYYSSAVSEVNGALSRIDWARDDFNDALLLAVIMLYIHGVSTVHHCLRAWNLVDKSFVDRYLASTPIRMSASM